MKNSFTVLLLLTLFSLSCKNEAAPPSTAEGEDSSYTYKLSEQEKHTSVASNITLLKHAERGESRIILPKINGHPNNEAVAKINEALTFEKIIGEPKDSTKAIYADCACGTVGADFQMGMKTDELVNFYIILQHQGAYPSQSSQFYTFDLTTGEQISITDLFKPEDIDLVLSKVNTQLRQNKMEKKETLEADVREDFTRLSEDSAFDIESLENFVLSPINIVFYYDFGFPHAVKALEPSGRVSFGWRGLHEHLDTKYRVSRHQQ